LAEDYLLDEVAAGKTRFTYSVAIEPRLALRLGVMKAGLSRTTRLRFTYRWQSEDEAP
jgi:hypothetical protein